MTDTERDNAYAEVLRKMVKVKTISVVNQSDKECFYEFHKVIKELFPTLFSIAQTEDFGGSLLIKWSGSAKEKGLPSMFMSHHDVVEATGEWEHEPFAADIDGGKLYGRGTLDTKNTLFAMLEAAEELAKEGFTPKNDIYFESACTEETDGSGAEAIVNALESRNIRFKVVYDEGGYILHNPIGIADHDFAVVGVGEKGTADLKFIARSNGGHASMPGKNTPLVRLGKFMAEVERKELFKLKMNDVTCELFKRNSEYMHGALKFMFKNINFFKPVLTRVLPAISVAAGAMLKTTLAFTEAHGSDAANVLPQCAWVMGNMRFSHHEGQTASFEKIRKLAEKYDIEMEIQDPGLESKISDYTSEEFKNCEKTIKKIFGDVATVPYIMTGASDCRYFSRICDNCFRFAPFFIDEAQLASIHGKNENINIKDLHKAVDFYRDIMENCNG